MFVYVWEICHCVGLPVVLRAAEVPFDLGGVMPTWAVMPLLQEPVWDIWASAAAFWPVSSYWHWAWEDEEEEDFQREEPLLGSMPASSSSSTFFRSWAPAQLLLTSGSACLDLLPFWTWRTLAADIVQKNTKKKPSTQLKCNRNLTNTYYQLTAASQKRCLDAQKQNLSRLIIYI